jgi:NTP pyrophosphatase (non-canonical NTP hydrolase)
MIENLNNYQQLADRTAKHQDFNFDLTHAVFGLTGEVGELTDSVKKHLVYNKPLDKENLYEELGDILWFVALAATTLDVSLQDIATWNIEKLSKRYPEKYTDELASIRLDKVPSEPVIPLVSSHKPKPWK